jgi:tRNA threonylcarbamoyladenosine biosynthesis protein TsaE
MHTGGERYSEQDVDRMAERLLKAIAPSPTGATVVGLTGELGAGKTTLAQAVAKSLAVADNVQSPTFVVMKTYGTNTGSFTKFVHMDAYRIDSLDELAPLRFPDILQEPNTLVLIEWPERIKEALPTDTLHISIDHDGDHRIITYGKS